jgi:hypothetical protein
MKRGSHAILTLPPPLVLLLLRIPSAPLSTSLLTSGVYIYMERPGLRAK